MAKKFSAAKAVSPKFLVIIAEPKIGKTTICMGSPDEELKKEGLLKVDNTGLKKALIIDMEDGTDYYEGHVERGIKTLSEIKRICKENRESREYEIVVIDSIRKYIEALIPTAEIRYKSTVAGKNYKVGTDDLIQVPFGAGTSFLEQEFDHIFETELKASFNKVIMIGHTKNNSSIEDASELSIKSIDTVGKIKNLVSRNCDSICFMTRKKNKAYLDFNNENAIAGSRISYLSNRKILISEKKGEQVETYWERVFPELYGKTVEDIIATMPVKEESTESKSDKKAVEDDI
jgi:hypothetical protein